MARSVLCMRRVGANPNAKVSVSEELPGKRNYFIVRDPKKWHTKMCSQTHFWVNSPTFLTLPIRE